MAFIKFKPLISRLNFYSELDIKLIEEELNQYLIANEKVIAAYKAYRDICLFTDKRILVIDKKGLRGFRKTVFSIKYLAISSYALNIRNLDSIIELTTDSGYKLALNFTKPIPLKDVFKIYRYLTTIILNK